jgi:tRNA A-37 threonylcarbamoyl transferase component Bud32
MSPGPEPFTDLAFAGMRWQVVPEHRAALFNAAGLRLEEWLRNGQARVIKHGPHRTVYRVGLPGLDFHLKHYRLHDTRAWLRDLVRPSKARMEYDRTVAVAARHIPTFVPLAVGERCPGWGPGDSFLLTRTLEDVATLGPFLETVLPGFPEPRQTRVRQRLAVGLGEFLARLHAAGILHNDLHTGNLLLHLDLDDRPQLYLIDLHAVQLAGGPLSWEASRANLVMLNRWFVLRAGRSDRRRFWEAYSRSLLSTEHSESIPEGGRHAEHALRGGRRRVGHAPHAAFLGTPESARDLERRTWASNLRFWRSRDRRCLANNRYYGRVRSETVVGHVVRDLEPAVLAPLLADPDEPFRRPGVRLLKDSPSSTVAELEASVNGVARRVIYKRFRVTLWSDPWVSLCRASAALRSWVFGHGLRERCLPTPRPLAVLHRRRHGLPHEGYLLTEKVPDAVELHRYATGLEALAPAERRRALRRGLEQVAALVRDLHRRQLAHRDLKAANILVQPGASGSRCPGGICDIGRLWLIDLVGVRRHGKLPRRRRVQNLARLHTSFCRNPLLTRTDKLRFLRTYLQCGLFGRERWKGWWRAVEAATAEKIARNLRSGRPLA